MKKKAALFFVFLTNIILLGHAVVPHHHLVLQAFTIHSTCTEHHKEHQHPCSDAGHDHGTIPEADHCVLSQAVGIPSNMLRQGYTSKSQLFDSDAPFDLGYLCHDNQRIQTSTGLSSLVRPPLLSFTYANYASAVLGLRAPPAR